VVCLPEYDREAWTLKRSWPTRGCCAMAKGGIKEKDQAWSLLYVVLATSANFGLHVGNRKFNTQTEQ